MQSDFNTSDGLPLKILESTDWWMPILSTVDSIVCLSEMDITTAHKSSDQSLKSLQEAIQQKTPLREQVEQLQISILKTSATGQTS